MLKSCIEHEVKLIFLAKLKLLLKFNKNQMSEKQKALMIMMIKKSIHESKDKVSFDLSY